MSQSSISKFGCSSLDEYLDLKSRNHAVESYCSEAELQIVLCKHYKHILHFAFILHDKDYFIDGPKAGELKEPHFHIVLHCSNDFKIRQVKGWFDDVSQANTFDELLLYKTRAYQYLTHSNNPDKWQYADTEVVTDSKAFWYDKEARSMCILYDIMHGADELYMCNTYGHEWIIHGSKYKEKAKALQSKVQEPFLVDNKLLSKKDIEEREVLNYGKLLESGSES